MAKQTLIEEFHLTVLAPRGLSTADYDAIRQALDDPRFHAALRRAICAVVRQRPALNRAKVWFSR